MNRLKKYASLLLALVMALALAVPAMASQAPAEGVTTGSITISNASKGHTYEAYQIFKGDLSYDDVTPGDLENPVLSNVQWGDSVDEKKLTDALAGTDFAGKTAAEIAAFLSDATTGGEATARKFAQAINGALTTPVKTGAVEEGATSCTIAEVPFGYYLIKDKAAQVPEGEDAPKDDAISLFMLQVVGPTTVASKVDVPTPDKKIVEDDYVCGLTESETEGGHKHTEACKRTNVADYDIGETITFELTAKLPNNYSNYETYKLVFHDTMSAGLTFDKVTSIKLGETEVFGEEAAKLYVLAPATDGHSLDVTFDNLKTAIPDATDGSVITVTYTAHLNENAIVGNPGNTNDMHLEFSNNPNDEGDGKTGETPDKEVVVFTYKLDTEKVDGQNHDVKLEGAEFKLRTEDGKWVVVDSESKVTGWADTEEGGSTLTSGKDGKFVIIGLDAGVYYLKETKAPTGYNLPDPAETKIEIVAKLKDSAGENALEELKIRVGDAVDEATGEAAYTPGSVDTGIVGTTIENNKGATLPETGGIGTTIFYALGGLLTVGAVVLLVTKKRMSADEK